MIRRATALVDWKRLALLLPLLAAVGVGVYVLTARAEPSAATPRATLVDTPRGAVDDVGVRRNQLARNFTGAGPDGAAVTLSDLRGRPTIINLWASWCTSCLAELPDFKALQHELGVEDLNVLAINTGEDASTAKKFIEELQIDTFHIVMDPTLVVADAYGVFGMPTSLFLDADGVVRATYVGHLSPKLMRAYLAAAQTRSDAGEPPPELRLITTVAREHTLEVTEVDRNSVELRSKSLRCDESYCADAAIESFAAETGVEVIERRTSEDPPAIVVRHDGGTTARALAGALAQALDALGDPLYQRPLEIVER